MINAQDAKAMIAVAPVTLDAESATSVVIDTYGFDYLTYYMLLGATDIALSALKAQECDTSGGSYTDVPDGAITNPSATDDDKVYGIFITMIGRKRYQKLIITAGDGTTGAAVAALALLTRGRVGTSDAAARGLAGQAIVV